MWVICRGPKDGLVSDRLVARTSPVLVRQVSDGWRLSESVPKSLCNVLPASGNQLSEVRKPSKGIDLPFVWLMNKSHRQLSTSHRPAGATSSRLPVVKSTSENGWVAPFAWCAPPIPQSDRRRSLIGGCRQTIIFLRCELAREWPVLRNALRPGSQIP